MNTETGKRHNRFFANVNINSAIIAGVSLVAVVVISFFAEGFFQEQAAQNSQE